MTQRRPQQPPQQPPSALQRWSAPMLVRLHALPRWVVPIVMALLLVAGLALEGIPGALALALVGLFLGWLLLLSWPLLRPGSRIVRVLVVGAILGVAWLEAFPPA